jgi:DNA helicase II / ATP-dependent DNA helicase PcrA
MEERLGDLGELGSRTFIGTLHGFCLDMLSDRGKPVGVTRTPQIFEQFADRKQILAEAVASDPVLNQELMSEWSANARAWRTTLTIFYFFLSSSH